ncbi:hypothetical protein TNCV_2343251 [Trichonephila clavipes]|nr:hypothetical protein TNCV_2343251 [Trichonephila clavipes]
MAQRHNLRRGTMTCRGCDETGHGRSNCSRNNKEDHSTWYWGCGGAGLLRNNYPGVNQKDPHRASVIESREVCSQRKGSADGTINGPSREPCPENNLLFSRSPDAPLAPEELQALRGIIQKLQARMKEMYHLARERMGMAFKKMKI